MSYQFKHYEKGSTSGSGSYAFRKYEASGGSSFDSSFEEFDLPVATTNYYAYVVSNDSLYFHCDLNTNVTVQYELRGYITTATTNSNGVYVAVLKQDDANNTLDDALAVTDYTLLEEVGRTTIDSADYGTAGSTFDYTVTATFTPRNEFNRLDLYANLYSKVYLTSIRVKIMGANIYMVNRPMPMNIECFDGKCYSIGPSASANSSIVYDQSTFSNFLSKLDNTNKLSEASMSSIAHSNIGIAIGRNLQLYPAITRITPVTNIPQPTTYNTTPENSAFILSNWGEYKMGHRISKTSSGSLVKSSNYQNTPESSLHILPGGVGFGGDCFLTTDPLTTGTVKILGTGANENTTSYIGPITYNGSAITKCWYSNVVKDNNLVIGDTPAFRGFVAWDYESKTNYFYPALTSTYRVSLGAGRNATAYYQSNGDINIYLNREDKIYKFVLTLDNGTYIASNTWGVIVATGCKYTELFNNYALVCNDNTYQIVGGT